MQHKKPQTPNFDERLNEILDNLHPHKKACKECQADFEISQEDIDFYKKLRVPPPSLCSRCRFQRRLGYRITLMTIFYKKKCSAPGHDEKIITFYPEESPIKVYDDDYYLSDNWDASEYARDYDFEDLFFKQFHQLAFDVPHQSLQKDPGSVDCDYVISGVSSKNCYYVTVPYSSENVYYAEIPTFSKECLDVSKIERCEQCYESVNLKNCYNCNFCYYSKDCLNSYFLYDCKNCSNCFGCVNLRNKKYHFFNKPLSKEEYEEKMREIDLNKRNVLKEYQSRFNNMLSRSIKRNVNNIKAENVVGDGVINSEDCFYVFFAIGGNKNLRYGAMCDKIKDAMDFYGCAESSFFYESTGVTYSNNIKFSILIRTSVEMEYCVECSNCQYCFGCFGLRNKKYHIFNKPYSEKEYWKKVDEIKTQMLENEEYGEFFPLSKSWHFYNESNASVEFPLSKEEVLEKGWLWKDEKENEIDLSKFKVLKAEEVPDDINNVSDDILKSVIICEQTGKPFRITEFELSFYRKNKLPLPVIHPLQRTKNRFFYRHPFKLWQYPCSECEQMMYSVYPPEEKNEIYCEKCYLKKVV